RAFSLYIFRFHFEKFFQDYLQFFPSTKLPLPFLKKFDSWYWSLLHIHSFYFCAYILPTYLSNKFVRHLDFLSTYPDFASHNYFLHMTQLQNHPPRLESSNLNWYSDLSCILRSTLLDKHSIALRPDLLYTFDYKANYRYYLPCLAKSFSFLARLTPD